MSKVKLPNGRKEGRLNMVREIIQEIQQKIRLEQLASGEWELVQSPDGGWEFRRRSSEKPRFREGIHL